MKRKAVLLVLFRRPDLTRLLLSAVIAARPDRVYVSIDGARSSVEGEHLRVQEVVDLVQSAEWPCPVEFRESQVNLGAGNHVRDAITWLFEHEEAGIILEDDCIPSPSFFEYSWHHLFAPRDLSIMSIGGYSPVPVPIVGNAPFRRTRYAMTWGWASWAGAWENYEFNLGDWRQRLPPSRLKEIGAGDPWFTQFWSRKFDSLEVGTRNIWDYQWVFAVWSQNGQGILPRVNLIQNRGFGRTSTHSFIERKIYATPSSDLNLNWDEISPKQLVECAAADTYLHRHFYQAGYAYPLSALARSAARKVINRHFR